MSHQCIKKFGCLDTCENLVLEGFEADSTGVYTLHVRHLNSDVEIDAAQVAGEYITFPITALNENYTYTGWVTDENGDVVRFSGMEKIQFTTSKTFAYGV